MSSERSNYQHQTPVFYLGDGAYIEINHSSGVPYGATLTREHGNGEHHIALSKEALLKLLSVVTSHGLLP